MDVFLYSFVWCGVCVSVSVCTVCVCQPCVVSNGVLQPAANSPLCACKVSSCASQRRDCLFG